MLHDCCEIAHAVLLRLSMQLLQHVLGLKALVCAALDANAYLSAEAIGPPPLDAARHGCFATVS